MSSNMKNRDAHQINNLVLAAFVVTGLLLFWSGLNYLNSFYDFMGTGNGAYNIVKLTITVFVIALGIASTSVGRFTEGISITCIGLSSIAFSITSMVFDVDGLTLLDVLISIPLFISTIIYAHRKQHLRSIASLILGLSLSYPFIADLSGMTEIVGIGTMVSGLLYAYVGMEGLIVEDNRKKNKSAKKDWIEKLGNDPAYEMTVIPCFFILGLLSIMSALSDNSSIEFAVASASLSIIIIAMAIRGLIGGIILEGVVALMYALCSMTYAIVVMADCTMIPLIELLFAITILCCGIGFILRKEFVPGIGFIIFGIVTAIIWTFDADMSWEYGSYILAIFTLAYSTYRWLVYTTNGYVMKYLKKEMNPEILKYKHYSIASPYLLVPTAGMIIMGILAIVNGSWGFHGDFNFLDFDSDSYITIKMIYAATILAFSVIAMRIRMLSDGILMLLMSMSALMSAVSEMSFGESGFSWSNIFFMLGFITCAYIFTANKQYEKTAATGILSFALLLESLSIGGDSTMSVSMIIAGILFIVIGVKNILLFAMKLNIHINVESMRRYSDAEYSMVIISTAGVMAFAFLSLTMGYYVLDTEHSHSLYLSKFVLAMMVMAFGTYALRKGIPTEGLMMLLVSLSASLFAMLHLFDIDGPILFDLIISFIFIPLAFAFYKEQNRTMTITSILLFFTFFLESFTSMASMLEVAIMMLKIVATLSAIIAWIYFEMPYKRLDFLVKHEHREVPDSGKYITITSFLMISLLILWAGITYINMDLVITETNLITYQCTKIALCAIAIVFAIDTFGKGLITEGIMNTLISISGLTFSVCYLVYGVSGPTSLDLLFSLGLYITTYLFAKRKDYALAFATGVFGVSLSIPFFYNVDTSLATGIGFVVTGLILAGYSVLGLISEGKWGQLHAPLTRSREKIPSVITVAGIFISGIMGLMLFVSDDFITYTVAEFSLSCVIALFSIYAIYKNHISEGIIMLMYCISTASYAACVILDVGATSDIDIVLSINIIATMALFLLSKNYLMVISAFGLGIICTIALILFDPMWNAGILIFAIPAVIYSALIWINNESDRKIPLISWVCGS